MSAMRWTMRLAALLTLAWARDAAAQHDNTSFSLFVENDAFVNSDTGYTNGTRFAWSIMRYRSGMRLFTRYNLVGALDGGLHALGLDGLRLGRLGLVPDALPNEACSPTDGRRRRRFGPCTILNLAVQQTMFTPDSLASTRVEPRDQPYAGFLYAVVGVTMLDSPRARDVKHWLGFTSVSHQVVLGVTGKPALGEDTQSLAHWTWATGSHRPMGWGTQLRTAPQIGLVTDIAARPARWEYCRGQRGCIGTIDERRRFDLTSRTELVAGTHMVRGSQGIVARLGYDFPDAVDVLRIPVSAPQRAASDEPGLVIDGQRFWGYVFASADARYVPYNMFLAGGLADGGASGWRTVRQIDPRQRVGEFALGAAVGNRHMTMRGQVNFRTPEYDVVGRHTAHGYHRYATIVLTVISPARGP